MLLALDTATASATVAILDGATVRAAVCHVDARRHTELLMPLIQQALSEASCQLSDLTHLAAGTGPGPFTSLRVGLVTARTLALSLDVPLLGVCSLDALALQAVQAGVAEAGQEFLVATDARRREVYWASYRSDGTWPVRLTEPAVNAAAEVPRAGQSVIGAGAQLYPQDLGSGHDGLNVVEAQAIARLAQAQLSHPDRFPAVGLDPLYLRRPDAAAPGERKRVLAR